VALGCDLCGAIEGAETKQERCQEAVRQIVSLEKVHVNSSAIKRPEKNCEAIHTQPERYKISPRKSITVY
jgi:hypothetical protein